MFSFLMTGIILGLSAGFAPGPLLTLVISETLRHNVLSGVKVALSPIVTDLPIILLSLFFLAQLSDFNLILGLISLAGSLFIFHIGWESICSKGVELKQQEEKPRSLIKGAIVNALSPHPYLFWLTVGGPLMTKAMDQSAISSAAFLIGFYLFLIGSKVLLAVVVGKSKSFLQGNIYIYTNRFLGITLWVLGGVLFFDGIKLLAS